MAWNEFLPVQPVSTQIPLQPCLYESVQMFAKVSIGIKFKPKCIALFDKACFKDWLSTFQSYFLSSV